MRKSSIRTRLYHMEYQAGDRDVGCCMESRVTFVFLFGQGRGIEVSGHLLKVKV